MTKVNDKVAKAVKAQNDAKRAVFQTVNAPAQRRVGDPFGTAQDQPKEAQAGPWLRLGQVSGK